MEGRDGGGLTESGCRGQCVGRGGIGRGRGWVEGFLGEEECLGGRDEGRRGLVGVVRRLGGTMGLRRFRTAVEAVLRAGSWIGAEVR